VTFIDWTRGRAFVEPADSGTALAEWREEEETPMRVLTGSDFRCFARLGWIRG
jgi:hypothetical protein